MIISKNNDFEFVLAAQCADFIYESRDRVVATIIVRNEIIPVAVYRPNSQFHVDIHPPFRIGGDCTWKAYEDLCQRPDTAFKLWIDPLDGEVKYCDQLTECTPEEVDRVVIRAIGRLEQEWDTLKRYHEMSEKADGKSHSKDDDDIPRGFLDLLRRGMMDEDD